jgi:hypothetical protein
MRAMSLFEQLFYVFVVGPLAIFRLRWRGAIYLAIYLALCGALLSVVGWALLAHRQDLIGALSSYLLPQNWRFAAERLVERMFASQVRTVLVNASVGTSLALLSALLFPLKEKVSATFERESRITDEPARYLPWWMEAIEEASLFIMFVTAQMTIFWIGYGTDPRRKQLAIVASYVVLFASFAVNFVAPLLQRQRMRYSTIIKVLLKHPIVLFGFGALFTLPSVLAANWARAHVEWSAGRAITVVFAANVACIALGILAGTVVAGRLLPDAQRTRPPSWPVRALAWLSVAALFAINVYAFGAVGLSLHRKSQILKCHYHIDPKSIDVDLPGVAALLHDPVELKVRLDLTVDNPTPYDVDVEQNRIEVRHEGALMAVASLSPLSVAAGQSHTQRLEVPFRLHPSAAIQKGRRLLDARAWTATLFLEVVPGFEFPVYLLAP